MMFSTHQIHAYCREEWGVESIIKAVCHRADGTLGGTCRTKMAKRHLKKSRYGRHWEIELESFISGLKPTTGSALLARTETISSTTPPSASSASAAD
jgi:hypothetical protein